MTTADDVRCVRCGAILPRHYEPCRATRGECEPLSLQRARVLGLVAYAILIVPALVAVLFGSSLSAGAIVGAVLFFWLTLYVGARHW